MAKLLTGTQKKITLLQDSDWHRCWHRCELHGVCLDRKKKSISTERLAEFSHLMNKSFIFMLAVGAHQYVCDKGKDLSVCRLKSLKFTLNLVLLWQNHCLHQQIPFHNLSTVGLYLLLKCFLKNWLKEKEKICNTVNDPPFNLGKLYEYSNIPLINNIVQMNTLTIL